MGNTRFHLFYLNEMTRCSPAWFEKKKETQNWHHLIYYENYFYTPSRNDHRLREFHRDQGEINCPCNPFISPFLWATILLRLLTPWHTGACMNAPNQILPGTHARNRDIERCTHIRSLSKQKRHAHLARDATGVQCDDQCWIFPHVFSEIDGVT